MTSTLRSLKIRIGGVLETAPFAYTYEEQLVLRLPPALAAQLQQEIAETGRPADMAITFTDARRATVTFHGQRLVGVLLDLPTVLETLKTTDRSQYCKVADISQMLLVLPEGGGDGETEAQLAEWEARGWQHPDGLTPPMHDVRNRRFNKTSLSYGQPREVEKIERQVQALLERDEAALGSTYTVYDAAGRAILRGGSGMDGKLVRLRPGEEEGGLEGELAPGDEYSDAILEEEEEEEEEVGGEGDMGGEEEDVDEFAAALEEEMMMADDAEGGGAQEDGVTQPAAALTTMQHPSPTPSPAVLELRARIEERKSQLASVTNPLIRARLEDVIRQLEQDLQARLNR